MENGYGQKARCLWGGSVQARQEGSMRRMSKSGWIKRHVFRMHSVLVIFFSVNEALCKICKKFTKDLGGFRQFWQRFYLLDTRFFLWFFYSSESLPAKMRSDDITPASHIAVLPQ